MIGQRRCSQTMNCWNFGGNYRVHVVILLGPRLLPMASFTLYVCVCTNVGLGCSLSKHAFHIQEIVASVAKREMVLFLLILTGKFAAYVMLLNWTSIMSSAHDSHSERDEESKLLSGWSQSW